MVRDLSLHIFCRNVANRASRTELGIIGLDGRFVFGNASKSGISQERVIIIIINMDAGCVCLCEHAFIQTPGKVQPRRKRVHNPHTHTTNSALEPKIIFAREWLEMYVHRLPPVYTVYLYIYADTSVSCIRSRLFSHSHSQIESNSHMHAYKRMANRTFGKMLLCTMYARGELDLPIRPFGRYLCTRLKLPERRTNKIKMNFKTQFLIDTNRPKSLLLFARISHTEISII